MLPLQQRKVIGCRMIGQNWQHLFVAQLRDN